MSSTKEPGSAAGRPGCEGKRAYSTREHAEESTAVKWAHGQLRTKQYPYECPFCGCWHTSSMTPAQAERGKRMAATRREKNAEIVQRLLKEKGLR